MGFGTKIILFALFWKQALAQTATCPCDLSQNACDVNCCCDKECTTADINAFTFCQNVDLNTDDKVCVSSQLINIANVQYRTSGSSNNLFCIYTDNNAARNFYGAVQSATTAASFNALLNRYAKTSFYKSALPTQTYLKSSIYKFGDPVLLLFESNVQGFLALPKPSVGTSECDDQNPTGFLKEENTKCSRFVTDLAAQCTSNAAYSALSYYSGFKLLPGPSFLAELVLYTTQNITSQSSATVAASSSATVVASSSAPVSTVSSKSPVVSATASAMPSTPSTTTVTSKFTTLASYYDPTLVNVSVVSPLQCKTSSGVIGACSFTSPPAPSYDFNTNTCKNVLFKAVYTINYDVTSSALNITSATVDFVLGDVVSSQASFTQEFTVKFQKQGSTGVFSRSGNPGYVRGLPVLAGTLQTNAQQKESITLNSNPKNWLTLVHTSATGTCATSSQRTSVKFGYNMRTGCFISIKQVMTTAECVTLQNIIYNTLLVDFPTHVAMFGNSAVTNTADWVKIINNKPSTPAIAVDGRCTNMILGVHIEILYSKTGYLGNPQSRIVGVQVKYDSPRILTFQCIAPYCQPTTSTTSNQNFEVSQSVSFVDVSTTPEAEIKPQPPYEAKAPYDFFYPFV
eukprot:gene16797-18492_t